MKFYKAVESGGAKVLGDRRMGKTSILAAAQVDDYLIRSGKFDRMATPLLGVRGAVCGD
jgi:hypothetical protein